MGNLYWFQGGCKYSRHNEKEKKRQWQHCKSMIRRGSRGLIPSSPVILILVAQNFLYDHLGLFYQKRPTFICYTHQYHQLEREKNEVHSVIWLHFSDGNWSQERYERFTQCHITSKWQARTRIWDFSSSHLPASYTGMLISSGTQDSALRINLN